MSSAGAKRKQTRLSFAAGMSAAMACAFLLAGTGGAQAGTINLVANGSFENTTATTNLNGTIYGANVDNTNLANWTTAGCGAGVSAYCGSQFILTANTNYIYYTQGNSFVPLASNPGVSPNGGNAFLSDADYENFAISQMISNLHVGDRYQLSFYQASTQQQISGASGYTGNWGVTFGGQTSYSSVLSNPAQGSTGWTLQTMAFIANATSESLSFLAQSSAQASPPFLLLDGVSLTDVPEPASYAILIAGLAAAMIVHKRRKAIV